MSDRLLALLEGEIAVLERAVGDGGSAAATAGAILSGRKGPRAGGKAEAAGAGEGPPGLAAEGSKARVEAVSQVTRTLEKLLELKRLELLAAAGGEEADAAETLRLRDEMMKRLRALDARRGGGAGLFGPDGALGGVPEPGGGEAGTR